MFLRDLYFYPDFFGHVGKRLDKKPKVNLKIYNVAIWLTNNYHTHIAQYLRSKGYQTMKFGQLMEYNMRKLFLENHTQNVAEKLVPDSFLKSQN